MRIPLLATLLLSSTITFADEDVVNGLYGGLFAAGSSFPGLTLNTYRPQFQNFQPTLLYPYGNVYTAPGAFQTDFGVGGGMNFGYRYNCFRIEGEFLYNVNSVGGVNYAPGVGLTTVDSTQFQASKNIANQNGQTYVIGQTNEYMGFANLYYDFLPSRPAENGLYPYVGLGLGYQKIQSNIRFKAKGDWAGYPQKQLNVYGCPGTGVCTNSTVATAATRFNGSSYLAQGIVGAGYEMDSYFNFYLDLRYMVTPKVVAYDRSFTIYTLNLGMNYSFASS